MNGETAEASLDDALMRYVGVNTAGLRGIQRFYLPFFHPGQRVLDLGCGDGDFVELLAENGIQGLGVDSDPAMTTRAQERGRPIVCQDAFTYLEGAAPDSFDGIFSAHFVEHLPYPKVMELIALAYRALRPGGILILATPNVRGLYGHLEGMYIHFGHVQFYHPQLLAFFLTHQGFREVTMGENSNLAYPYFGQELARLQALPPPFGPPRNPLHLLKQCLWRVLLYPYLRILQPLRDTLVAIITRLDRPLECYALGRK